MKPGELPADAIVLVLEPMDSDPHRFRALAWDLKRMKRRKEGAYRCLSVGPPEAHREILAAMREMFEEQGRARRRAV